jgi:hypothetical protein
MALTARAKWEIVGAIAAALVLAIVAGSWLGAREDQIRMKTTIDAQNQVIASAQKQAEDIQDAEDARDKASAATVAAIQQAAAKQVTPAEIAAWIPKQLAGPQPITLQIPAPTAQNPSPNATASIPEADLPALRDQITACQTCSVKLSTAQADLTSRDQQAVLAQKQIDALKTERDAAVKASKGGGFWSRVKAKGKWFVIGGGVAGAAICATGHCK